MEDKNSNRKFKFFKRLKKRKLGLVFLGIQALLTLILTVLLIRFRMLKPIYNAGIFLILLILLVVMALGQGSKGRVHKPLKVVTFLISILLGVGSYFIYTGTDAFATITDSESKDEFQIIVLEDSEAQTINDVKNEEFGVDTTQINAAYKTIVDTLQSELEQTIDTKEYVDSLSLVDALYNKECNVIILNTAVMSDIEENHKNFKKETKILNSYEHVTHNDNSNKVESITEEPFSVYLSGIDTYGDIATKSRSDVNIIATVNPKTKEILLTATPRDYFVQTSVSGTQYDKLTHAGLYGVECSMETLEKLYGVKINYYAKVNFSGFQQIIDALGGVTVNASKDFVAQHGERFYEGENKVDGAKALAFVRERHAFGSGDLQRNKNQQELIRAVIEKAASPAILGGFADIMDAVKDSVRMNLTYDEIAELVQMQLDDGSSWHITSFGVSGKGGSSTTYSNQKKAGYVMYMDEEKIAEASRYINQVINGMAPTITED